MEDTILHILVKHLRSSRQDFKKVMYKVLDPKAVQTYEKKRNNLILKNSLLYHKTCLTKTGEDLWCLIMPKSHQGIALNGYHYKPANQGQHFSLSATMLLVAWYDPRHDSEDEELCSL